jgi:hypothetical protein
MTVVAHREDVPRAEVDPVSTPRAFEHLQGAVHGRTSDRVRSESRA